jgi:hypothetical protein
VASSPAPVETHNDLSSLLTPVDAGSFLASDYGRRFVYVPGTPGKFSTLLPWPVLNEILEQHRLEPPRLRLTREGKPVAPEKYLSYQANRRKSGRPIPRLNATALTRELRDGATLVLDSVDELHRPIRRIAESLERVFHVRVQVNSYAGWRSSHGFDLHWDDHDVFILQVAGRKHWQVYDVTRPYPLGRDVMRSTTPPTEVLWEGLLQSGDLLYIPRGWWHVATPLDEPTLHLTVGVNNLTGADLLTWFADRMRNVEDVRRDVPHLEGADARREYANRLRDAILREWKPELMDEFVADMDAKARPRPSFHLPFGATPRVLPEGSFRIVWNAPRRSTVEEGRGEVTVITNGRKWRFAMPARPMLEALISGRECSLDELRQASGLAADVVREFVRELASNGLVTVR